MAVKAGPTARARQRADEDDRRVRLEIGRARRAAGLSHDAVGAACGISGSAAWRIEHGITKRVDIRTLACLGAVVGRDVRFHAFPAGDAIRDAGHVRLLDRLRGRLHPGLGWRTEVPIPIANDGRAWDALIRAGDWVVGVEAETVLDDFQAVERRLALKARDGGLELVILLVGDTRRNRRVLAAAPNAFPGLARDARTCLRALAAGERPPASTIVVM